MTLVVSNNPDNRSISVGSNNGGSQGGTYNPQGGGSGIRLQGSSPVLQSSNSAGIRLQNTGNPQVVANFGNPTANPAGDNLRASTDALLKSLGYSNGPVYAPKIDLAAINAQARKAAEGNVNPYYTKALNDFLAEQASAKAQQQAQTKTNIQNAQDLLTQTTKANAVTGTRTTEDTAQKESDINQAADWRQTDQGGQYDIDRVAQAINEAKSGLTGSGIAAGERGASQEKFNTTESRQATSDTENKAAAELTKARTFQDLATSNENATTGEAKAEKQANFDLTNFITGQDFALKTEKSSLEKSRLGDIATNTSAEAKLLLNQFIANIANPAQRLAAYQTYGSAF